MSTINPKKEAGGDWKDKTVAFKENIFLRKLLGHDEEARPSPKNRNS